MDIMLIQMIFVSSVQANVKHVHKMQQNAQIVLLIEYFQTIYATAFQGIMILRVDAKDVHINVPPAKILQHNVYHVIQYLREHYHLSTVFVILVILILEHLFVFNAHKHA